MEMTVDYTAQLDAAIERLHEEGRYRTFIDIERRRGQFPHAVWTRPDGSEQEITVCAAMTTLAWASIRLC